MTSDDALAIAAAFGIELDGARVAPLSGGYSNDLVRVDADGGSYVVRRYGRLHVTRAAIAFEHRIMAHAARRLPEVVAPLRTAAGRTIVTTPDHGIASVLPFVAGESDRRDLATARAAAALLARFHVAMRDVHVAGGMRTARFLGTLPWLRERFLRFANDRLVQRALDWSALITATSAATVRIAPLVRELPVSVVHGDPNPGNVVTAAPGDLRGLIDFDFAHEDERLSDVGAFVDEFARDGDDEPLELERIAPLVDAYAEQAPLTRAERELLPEAMVRRSATLVWYVVTRHGERVPGDIGGARRYAARVAEIVEKADRIRALLRE